MRGGFEEIILVLLPVIVGAVLAVVPTLLVERARQRATINTRWDVPLHSACADFAATAHRFVRLSHRIVEPDTNEETRGPLIKQIYDEHAHLRSLMEQVWLLCGSDLQRASRMVVRHASAVREFAIAGIEPYSEEFASSPQERFSEAILAFYRAARRQLQIGQPDWLAPRDPPRGGY
jgi:hypothetical protein